MCSLSKNRFNVEVPQGYKYVNPHQNANDYKHIQLAKIIY